MFQTKESIAEERKMQIFLILSFSAGLIVTSLMGYFISFGFQLVALALSITFLIMSIMFTTYEDSPAILFALLLLLLIVLGITIGNITYAFNSSGMSFAPLLR